MMQMTRPSYKVPANRNESMADPLISSSRRRRSFRQFVHRFVRPISTAGSLIRPLVFSRIAVDGCFWRFEWLPLCFEPANCIASSHQIRKFYR
jgi:hypothetical protein